MTSRSLLGTVNKTPRYGRSWGFLVPRFKSQATLLAGCLSVGFRSAICRDNGVRSAKKIDARVRRFLRAYDLSLFTKNEKKIIFGNREANLQYQRFEYLHIDIRRVEYGQLPFWDKHP